MGVRRFLMLPFYFYFAEFLDFGVEMFIVSESSCVSASVCVIQNVAPIGVTGTSSVSATFLFPHQHQQNITIHNGEREDRYT
jgi:hypothetical protein